MNTAARDFFGGLARALEGEAARSRGDLVPPAFAFLWETTRFIVVYGGRAAAKSWSIVRVLLALSYEQPLRILCCREIQSSLTESSYRLIADQITALRLDEFFTIQSDRIIGRNGSCFFFEGLRHNASKIRSYEGVDAVWIEEAQAVSEMSWETLLPTVRKRGSRIYVSFNPMEKTDPVMRRFVDNTPPGAIVRKVSYRDNPFLSPEAEAERQWLEKTDEDAYKHVWEGFPRTVSDALILRGKFEVAEFEARSSWSGPHHGLDFGFSRDPSAAVRAWIDDETRTLYIDREFWQLGCEIDALPSALEAAIPGISRHVVYADSSRPESISYIARNGIASCRPAEKWSGSVDDGIGYLRSFKKIVIHPDCKHLLDEARSYSFKCDRLTGAPLPEPEDKNNHAIDSLRYALSPLIRNLPVASYFNRSAFLVAGEPVTPPDREAGRPQLIFVTVALCDRPGSAVGAIFWASSPHHGHPLVVLDYDLIEIEQAQTSDWVKKTIARAAELRTEWDAVTDTVMLLTEAGELADALGHLIATEAQSQLLSPYAPAPFDSAPVDPELLPKGLDLRANTIRASVNAGKLVKIARSAYAQQLTHRNVTANHLLNQLLGFRPDAKDAPQELAAAVALGVLVTKEAP